ncbi:MAG: hypothetical protein WC722_00725 [Rhodospirillales bacterium]|jgi:hypothetical protein
MIDFSKMFDEYGRKAQLFPALLVIFSPLVTAIILFPSIVSLNGTVGTVIVGSGILFLLANITREAGRRKQDILFQDGLPSVRYLRHSDLTLERPTKERYKAFLLSKVPNLSFPSKDEEDANKTAADESYQSAVRWLLENSRSNRRVQQELIVYGFRRNLYGIKFWGLLTTVMTAAVTAYVMWSRYVMAIETLPPEVLLAFITDAVVLPTIWMFAISQSWVKSAANSYALALLGFCDARLREDDVV